MPIEMKLSLFPPKPPLSLITKIFFFLIVVFTTQAEDDEYYMQCNKTYTCGPNPEIKYPFWGGDRPWYCGVQGYKVTCEENMLHPIFKMGTQSFYVLNINRPFDFTIAREDLFYDLCPWNINTLNNTAIDTTLVNYGLGTENLTLFYSCPPNVLDLVGEREKIHCKDTDGIALNKSSRKEFWSQAKQGCQNNITVGVMQGNLDEFETGTLSLLDLVDKGFEVVFESQMEEKLQWCRSCEASGGICGTTNMSTNQFTCFCKDGPQDESCPGNSSTVGRNIGTGSSFMKMKTKTVTIGVCSIIGMLLLIIVFWCFRNVLTKEISKRRKKKCFKENGGLLLQQQLFSSDCKVEKIKMFKSYELENATNHYNVDRVLGQGGQGTVYKGILPDGRLIAVKKSKIVDPSNVGQFVNEVVILSKINHRNIVKLLGCCLETEVPMLVYEFISNGTLYQHIQNPKEEFRLSWEMRLRIAAEIAGTLSYLHNAAPVPIYHRDIKSTNILLDDKYQAKVSDFGISRSVNIDISHLTTLVRGTFGYLDPEYYQSSRFTEKSDVYSFGVVLVELLTGRKPIFSNTSQEFKGLVPHFMESMEESHFLDMIDPQLSKEDKIEEMVEVAHLAKACLNSIGKRRPAMKEITVQLEGIRMSREQTMSQKNDGIDHGKAYDSSNSTGAWSESSATSSMNVDISIELKESIKIG